MYKYEHKWVVNNYVLMLILRFYEETGFPGVIGAVDCTHVRIKKPQKSVENCYLNRKGLV